MKNKIISSLNMKGGVGKTTTSLNLSSGLALKGYKVLLVDYDPQSNSTSIYLDNKEPDITISDLMKGNKDVKGSILKVDKNLWLIPSELELSNAEMEMRMQTKAPQHNRLEKILTQVVDDFDYIIIDCAPIINLLTVNAIIASDKIIVPIKPDKFALQGFGVTVDNIRQITENFDLDNDFKVLFTIVNRNNEERDMINQLRELVGKKAYNTQIRSQPKPIASASANNTVVIKNKKANVGVAEDYRKFVDEFLEDINNG